MKFTAKEHISTSDDPIIRQFLAGRAKAPIGMGELAIEQGELVEREEPRLASAGVSGDEIMTV